MQNISLSKSSIRIIFSILFFSMVVSVTAQTPTGFNLLAYEGFDYSNNTNIANQSGGTGWAGNWEANYYGDSSMFVYSSGFSYTGLNVTGNKLAWGGSGTYEPHSVRRAINNPNSGIVYLQFISDFNSSSAGTDRLDLNSGGNTIASFGGNNPQQKMSIMAGGQIINSAYSVFDISLVIIQIDYNNLTTKMWVNPTLSTFDYSNPGTADAIYNDSIAFDQISLTFRSGGQIDEISVFSLKTSAPTSISGTTTICNGSSTTLTSSGGNLSSEGVDVWYEGACGGQAFYEGFNTQPTTTYQTAVNSNLNGILNVSTTGTDPEIEMYNLGSFDPAVYKYINFRYRVVSGTAVAAQLFFLNSTDTFASGSKYLNEALVSDNQWHTASVDMSTHALWATGGAITGFRYDYATNSGVTIDLDFIELSTVPIVGTGSSITVSPSTTTTYYANRKGYNVNTACVSQAVTVNALPVPSFTDQPNDIVLNTDVSYKTVSGQSSYSWTIPGILNTDYSITSGGTSSDNALVLKWLTKGSKTVSINYTNANNCTATNATSSNSITARNIGISVNGSKISNTALSLDSNGKIGSGKSVSRYGELMDSPLPPLKVVGETYQGGTIFYLSAPGSDKIQHGLIRTEVLTTNASYNTTVSTNLPNYNAANLNGYNDWRLPNYSEAVKICPTVSYSGYLMSSTVTSYASSNIEVVYKSGCQNSNLTKTYSGIVVVLVRNF